MSTHSISRPPAPVNEPVRDYVPGSPERARLQVRLEQMRNERPEIPLVIGGKDVTTGDTRPAVMPHDKEHVLADVHQGGSEHVEAAIDAAAEAWKDWSRRPWEDRAAVFLRAAELLAGPWRDTLNAATMLGQSKTAHQAEIDAACELLAGIHFACSTPVFNGMWRTIAQNMERYRNYPRIVGETGGKDFIVAHASANVDALATAIVRGSFEYQGQKCSAASRVYAPSNLWPQLRER